jgi:hypothetical protein
MTPEQAAQRVRQIAFMLEKADYGLGMPRDYQHVLELRVALDEAIKDHANALLAQQRANDNNRNAGYDITDSDYDEQMGGY